MKVAVRYFSKTGNTRKLAEEIATAANVEVHDVSVPLQEDVDILFLGSSVYAAGVDKEVKAFIQDINYKVGKVVNFSTAALIPSTYKQVKKLIEQKGIKMSEDEFHCRGSFMMMHKGRPDPADLKEVVRFAEQVLNAN